MKFHIYPFKEKINRELYNLKINLLISVEFSLV